MAQNGIIILKIAFVFFLILLLVNVYLILLDNSSSLPLASIDPESLLINLPGCQIPKLDPLHFTVRSMVQYNEPLNCKQKKTPLILSGIHSQIPYVKLNQDASKEYGSNVTCSYRVIRRVTDKTSNVDSNQYPLKPSINNITDEFIRVDCVNNLNENVYYDYFAFIQHKSNVDKRCKIAKNSYLKSNPNEDRFNILLIGIDSLSRNQFLRHMKKTYGYIKNNLNFIELFGYNKIGANTFPNMVAMLTGHLSTEVADLSRVYANSLPLIWNDYMEAGYRSLFAEDTPTITIFNYARKGFDAQPTDYYLRPFSLAAEDGVVKKGKQGCFKDRTEDDVILKWTLDLFEMFPEDPLFLLTFLTRLSHENFNGLSLNDEPYTRFFQQLHERGFLNRTIIFFFGDHGFRFGKIRSTYVGRLEDKLPFAMFLFPSWFQKTYPAQYSNLKMNSYRLTTPLDIYATLKHLLNFKTKPLGPTNHRSVNLFGSVVSGGRTCVEAQIPLEYCSCIKLQQTKKTDKTVIKAAQKLIEAVNAIVQGNQSICEQFELDGIEQAAVQLLSLGESPHDKDSSNYRITIKVKPGGAVFEGVVWHYADKDTYTVHANIERVNFYGNQSSCVDVANLKPFCYCKNQ